MAYETSIGLSETDNEAAEKTLVAKVLKGDGTYYMQAYIKRAGELLTQYKGVPDLAEQVMTAEHQHGWIC